MKIVNGRLIIDENKIDEACEKIKSYVSEELLIIASENFFSYDDFNIIVYFDDECWNDETYHCWNEINIDIYKDKEFLSNICYSTESYEPTLVNENGAFKFYYVFTNGSMTCTNPLDMKNTGHSKFPCDHGDTIENKIIKYLEEKLG